ncbi:uncharacterized protein ACBR49_005748 [Aulostomus maculatus]
MAAHVLLLLALGAAASDSQVKFRSDVYWCCSPTVPVDPDCYHSYDVKGKSFFTYQRGEGQCALPCREFVDERMTLDSCVEFNASILHNGADNNKWEEVVSYSSQPCSGSDSVNHNTASRILLLLVLPTWAVL